MQAKVKAFNERYPIGSTVTIIKDSGEKVNTKVKYAAEILSGHSPVVWLEGIAGCYMLDRVI
jgi:hypothetical protein